MDLVWVRVWALGRGLDEVDSDGNRYHWHEVGREWDWPDGVVVVLVEEVGAGVLVVSEVLEQEVEAGREQVQELPLEEGARVRALAGHRHQLCLVRPRLGGR